MVGDAHCVFGQIAAEIVRLPFTWVFAVAHAFKSTFTGVKLMVMNPVCYIRRPFLIPNGFFDFKICLGFICVIIYTGHPVFEIWENSSGMRRVYSVLKSWAEYFSPAGPTLSGNLCSKIFPGIFNHWAHII